jgi:flavin reductase (DIM6/NTAB) family NADH-FMN oxidoreductase RutF
MKRSIGAKTIIYPTPVLVVGTYDRARKPNAMTAAWAGICCSMPPCLGVSLRKATYSYGNIMDRKAFTINVPSESYARQVDYLGMASGRDVDKFAATGLTPIKGDYVDAPYIKEFPLALECSLLNAVEIGLHTQFIGEIMDIKVEEEALGEGDLPDIEKVLPMIFAPEGRKYYGLGKYLGDAFSIGKEFQAPRQG